MKLIESSMRRQLLEVRLTSFHNLNATIENQTLNDELAFVQFLIVLIYSLIDHNNFHLGSQVDTHLHWITISSQSHVARRLSLFNNYSIMTRRLYTSIAHIVVACSQVCQRSHLPWNSWCQVLLNTHYSIDFHLHSDTSYFHVEQTKIVLLLVPYCPSLRMIAVGNSICFFLQETWGRWHCKCWCNCIL